MTTLFLSHPNFENSYGNRLILEHFKEQNPAVVIRHLESEYPDRNIDVKKEQKIVLETQTLIFQFPIFWYYCPSMLKQWLDEVFTIDLLQNHEDELRKKRVIVSFTAGGTEESYTSLGQNERVLHEYLVSFPKLIAYMKMTFHDFVISYGVNKYANQEELLNQLKHHSEKLSHKVSI